jgi:hypothetical protein
LVAVYESQIEALAPGLRLLLLNSVRDPQGSLNFLALRGVVNNTKTVYAESTQANGLRFDARTDTIQGFNFTPRDLQNEGQTLPSQYSGFAVSLVQVNPYLDARESAATMAHELYGHSYPCMLGLGCTHADLSKQFFNGIEGEAYSNFNQKP